MTPLILDGGMSRELQRLGAPFRQPEWSALALIEAPHFVGQAHTAFVDAGADVITTNSYALVPFHIGEDRFAREGAALASLAGRLARAAADAATDRTVRVAGSLPPVFGSYEPERFDPSRVGAYLAVLVDGLRSSVDLWLGETLSSIAEAEAARAAVAETGLPLWISFTLRDDPGAVAEPPMLRSGETVSAAADWAAAAGLDGLLFNCSQPEVMEPAIMVAADRLQRAGQTIPIGVYANAFRPVAESHKANEGLSLIRSDLDAVAYAAWAERWTKAGATMVGGCCGIQSHHIRALSDRFRCDVG